jgi:ABC-type multidrug transport system fused ATPase/permease subunit
MERNTMDAQGTARAWDSAAAAQGADTNNASLGRLFRDLADDLSNLTRKEIELARTETMEKISHASKAVISMAAGGFIAYAGLLFLLAAAVMVIATWVPYWLSAVIVGGVAVIIGLIMLQGGRSALAKTNITPEKTVDTMKENAQWVKEKIQ